VKRSILKHHKKLSVLVWIIATVSWKERRVSYKVGRRWGEIQLKTREVIAAANRIHKETGVSVGMIHKTLQEFKRGGLIRLRKVKAGEGYVNVVELLEANPLGLLKPMSESETSTRNEDIVKSKSEYVSESKLSTTEEKRVNDYKYVQGAHENSPVEGDSHVVSTSKRKPWERG
jgi:hypothetical protein|tara:strand:+ start:966 stop:1487 length:522 start_codon:yes stop_codon:yes gene_type:complete